MIRVNGYEITEKEFDMALEERRQAMRKEFLEKSDVEQVADILVEGALMLGKAQEENVAADEKEIADAISGIRKRFKTEEDFINALKSTDDDQDSLRNRIERNLKLRNFVLKKFFDDTKVSDDDLQKYYDKYPESFTRGEEVRASHILFSEKNRQTALEVHEMITEQNGDSEEHARMHSECPSGGKGGDLCFFGRGMMVPEFEKAAFSMSVGDISDLVQTQFGFHIIKLTDKKSGGTFGFDEVKEQLRQSMTNSIVNHKIKAYTSKLKENADIFIDRTVLEKKFPE